MEREQYREGVNSVNSPIPSNTTVLSCKLRGLVLIPSSVFMYTKGKVHPRTDYEGREVELYCFFNLGARWGGWSTPWPLYPWERDMIPIVQEAG